MEQNIRKPDDKTPVELAVEAINENEPVTPYLSQMGRGQLAWLVGALAGYADEFEDGNDVPSTHNGNVKRTQLQKIVTALYDEEDGEADEEESDE